jgi:uncharacterized membrane protein HdeD (DUF308 family)
MTMADKIDELELDISVTENQAAKKITQVSKAISQLTETLNNLKSVSGELDKLSRIKLPSSLKNVKNLKINYKLQTATIPQVSTPQTNNFNGIQTDNSAKTQLESVKGILDTITETSDAQAEVKVETEKTSDALKQNATDLQNVNKQQKKNNKETKQSATLWSKLTRSIVRIGFYRVVRTALNQITNGLKTGIDNLRSANDGLDDSMNRISASTTTLQNSLASLLTPLIQSFEPIFTRISDSIANVVNQINEAKAAMAGQSSYTKILTSDTEEYQKALEKTNGTLLEFDTFTTLNSKNSGYKGVIKSPVDMSKNEAEGILKTLDKVKETLANIVGLIGLIGITSLIGKISKLASALKTINNPLASIQIGVGSIVMGLTLMTSGIKDIVDAFKNGGSTLEKTSAILKTLAGALMITFGVIVMTKAAQTAKTIVGVVAGIATAAALITSAIATTKSAGKNIQSFAQGGSFNTADMFYANEDGRTELIASSNSGGGAVMNLDQWATVSETSFYNALARYGVAQNQKQSGFDMNSFGKMLAGNTGFIGEMNRRNTALNLR